MKASEKLLSELRALEECDVCDWIYLVRIVGRDPATFFERRDWTGVDFSMSNMSGVSFRGATINHAIFRKGDLTRKVLDEARSAAGAYEKDEIDPSDEEGFRKSSFPHARADRQQAWMNFLSSNPEEWKKRRKDVGVQPDFEGQNLTFHLIHSDISGSEINGFDFSKSHFRRTRMNDLVFANCDFEGANMDYADLARSVFERCNLKDVQFRYANLTGCSFRGSDLTGVSFRDANIAGANFSGAKLSKTDFSSGTLEYVDFSRQCLTGFSFSRARLRGADFSGANLEGADFSRADLNEVCFVEATLDNVNLTSATLRNCDFQSASLTGSCVKTVPGPSPISRPNFVDLTLVKNLAQEQISGMLGDSGTILPVGLIMPDSWPQVTHESLWPNIK